MSKQFLQGWLTWLCLGGVIACLAAKKYLELAVPDEVLVALVGGVVFGIKRQLGRIEEETKP